MRLRAPQKLARLLALLGLAALGAGGWASAADNGAAAAGAAKPAPPAPAPRAAPPAPPPPPPATPPPAPPPVDVEAVMEGPALDADAEEMRLLASALRQLRRERDPAEALRLLDQHRARVPASALAAEATVVRIDALLALGRRHAALEILEGLSLTGYSRRRELLVLRGELQTDAGDCTDALLDLDVCARVPAGDEIEERAVYGKAVCLARLGQRAEASAVLQGYLRRFPRGRFVKPALESLLAERP